MACEATVHENVCVQATVTIRPRVDVGDVDTFCIDGVSFRPCPGTVARFCTFTVSQNICVEIPLTFAADVTTENAAIVCGTPRTGECPDDTAAAE